MLKILTIDDDPIASELVRVGLSDAGYHVFAVPSGAAGLEICDSFSPDLIVLDNVMPGLSGPEVLLHLRRNAKMRDIPVLMLTGLSDMNDVVRGLDMGADDYVIKPFKLVELAARIEALIRRKTLRSSDAMVNG